MTTPALPAVSPKAVANGTSPNGGVTTSQHRPAHPRTRLEAAAARPWYYQRTLDSFRRYQVAKRDLEQARGELAIVDAMIAGEFDEAEPAEPLFAVGSRGSWCVDLEARYVVTERGRAELREALG